MGYRSDTIAVSRDMGPLRMWRGYVFHHPHLHPDSITAVSYCIVTHCIMKLASHQLQHESNVIVHLKLCPADLIKDNVLIPFNWASGSDMESENMQHHFINIHKHNIAAAVIQGPSSNIIKEIISQPNFLNITCWTTPASVDHLISPCAAPSTYCLCPNWYRINSKRIKICSCNFK